MDNQKLGAAELLTVDEVARLLRIGRSSAYELVRRGELRSVKIGRARRVSSTAVASFIERAEADSEFVG
jgi:excisionase family DNA binding protein